MYESGKSHVRAWKMACTSLEKVMYEHVKCHIRAWKMSWTSLENVIYEPVKSHVRAWEMSFQTIFYALNECVTKWKIDFLGEFLSELSCECSEPAVMYLFDDKINKKQKNH